MKVGSFAYNGSEYFGLVGDDNSVRKLKISDIEKLHQFLHAQPEALEDSSQMKFESVPWQFPVLKCPLFLFIHGNSPTIWKEQGPKETRWCFPRVPFPRIRPRTSFSGDSGVIHVPLGANFLHDVELGVVLGRTAKNVTEEESDDYIFGYTCLDDCYTGIVYSDFSVRKQSPYEHQALTTLMKAADGNAHAGPWIVSCDEIDNLYDLLVYSFNGKERKRSHTGGYLWRAKQLIAYLSRFMTLPAGTVIGLGSPGWDGQRVDFSQYQKAGDMVDNIGVEIENIGCLNTKLIIDEPVDVFSPSPYLIERQKLNLKYVPTKETSGTIARSFWMLRGNYKSCKEVEGIPCSVIPCPHLYPPLVLADSSTPVVFPRHTTKIRCSCQLGAVIGREAYRVPRGKALEFLRGMVVLLVFNDSSLEEPIQNPYLYESRAAYFLGGCADGFARISPIVSVSTLSLSPSRSMQIFHSGKRVTTSTQNYHFGIEDMLVMITKLTTLLPGDIISLGPSGEQLVLSVEDGRVDGKEIGVSIDGLDSIVVRIVDQRDPAYQDYEKR